MRVAATVSRTEKNGLPAVDSSASRRTIDVRGSANASWPFELTHSPDPGATRETRLAVGDES